MYIRRLLSEDNSIDRFQRGFDSCGDRLPLEYGFGNGNVLIGIWVVDHPLSRNHRICLGSADTSMVVSSVKQSRSIAAT